MKTIDLLFYILTSTPANILMACIFLLIAAFAVLWILIQNAITWIQNEERKLDIHVNFFKAISILIVSSLSMLANNTWVYGVTIFIIASLMAENSFLENLAAIFRGGDYFGYKKESKHPDKPYNSITFPSNRIADAVKKQGIGGLKQEDLNEVIEKLKHQDFERFGLDYLGKILNLPIEQKTKISKNNKAIELDGFVDKSFRQENTHLCIEIKKYKSIPSPNELARIAIETSIRVEEITGEFAETILLIIYDSDIAEIAKSRISKTATLTSSSRFVKEVIGITTTELLASVDSN